MAGVVDQDPAKVVIKKEVEDTPESPDQADVQDSPPSQTETNGSQKHTKVMPPDSLESRVSGAEALPKTGALLYKMWSEEETRSMLELQKSYAQRFEDGNYSKKQLLEDVAQELNLIGYDATPEKVRNKMKYLRARYKGVLQYNAKHVEKKVIPFQNELDELYNNPYFDEEPLVNGNGSSDLTFSSSRKSSPKKRKAVPSLKDVLARKKSSAISKATKIKKKARSKRSAQPLFQCGLCLAKFRASSEMHVHNCKSTVKMNHENKKKVSAKSPPHAFHWNSLITMQFLDILKDYQGIQKNSSFRKGNIWENVATHMKRLGHKIPPAELSRKWKLLSTNFEKTVAYNKTHKDKKKCAFFKRLMELHNHNASFNCFTEKSQSAKQTVEVSPFSFSQASSSSKQLPLNFNSQKNVKEQSSSSDLIAFLNNTWSEYKEIEMRRREAESQRHNEIMEMLSYLIDCKDKHH